MKNKIILTIIFILTITLFILGLLLGNTSYSIKDLFNPKESSLIILYQIRLPRLLGAFFAGASLSLSGLILQSLFNNDLASPKTIGMSSGSLLFLTLGMLIFPTFNHLFPLFAFIGAVITTIIIYFIASFSHSHKFMMLLSGIAISALFDSLIKILFVFFPDIMVSSNDFMIGTFSNIKLLNVIPSVIIIIICLIITLILKRALGIITLGDNMAKSLGLNVKLYRAIFVMLACLLSASVVAYAGALGFIGLVIPHLSYYIFKTSIEHRILKTFMLGGFITLLCDILVKNIFYPYDVQAGIIISLLCAPFFIYLILRRGNK